MGGGGGGEEQSKKRGKIVCEKPLNWVSILTLVAYWYNDGARLFVVSRFYNSVTNIIQSNF